jgi:hypothetical protein
MFTIYSEKEWSKILTTFPRPCDEIKEIIWEKTRKYPVPTVNIDLKDAIKDFNDLKELDTNFLIKEGDLFSRYEYKWNLGHKYIDSCNIGNKSSNYFHQDLRYKCDSINSPSPWRNWNDKKFFFTLCNALWSLKVKEVTSETLRSCIALRKYIASQFRPSAAKAIYDNFKAKNVLDFSSGWGDRLSAAMAAETVQEYIGIDPNKELYAGYQQQIRLFSNKPIMNMFLPAEEAVQVLNNFEPDLIFTSPPYFIVERYSKDSSQSWQKYKKLDIWLDNFLFKTLKDSWKLLKSGGYLAINISDVYCNHTINKICDPMNNFISKLKGARKIDNINYRMSKRLNSKSDKKGIFVEPIWCWQKQNIGS